MKRRKIQAFLIFGLLISYSTHSFAANCMESDPYYWQGDRRIALYDKLMPLMTCKDYGNSVENALADKTACNWFLGRALEAGFGVKQFTPTGEGWKTANQISAIVSTSADWSLLGMASDSKIVQSAATIASAGRAVIAVEPGEPNGHVALILPGPPSASGTWGSNAPNSASFFLDKVASSYVGCKLSFAFKKPQGVKIYAHK